MQSRLSKASWKYWSSNLAASFNSTFNEGQSKKQIMVLNGHLEVNLRHRSRNQSEGNGNSEVQLLLVAIAINNGAYQRRCVKAQRKHTRSSLLSRRRQVHCRGGISKSMNQKHQAAKPGTRNISSYTSLLTHKCCYLNRLVKQFTGSQLCTKCNQTIEMKQISQQNETTGRKCFIFFITLYKICRFLYYLIIKVK